MSYPEILRDEEGNPIPQIWDAATNSWRPWQGEVQVRGRSQSVQMVGNATTADQSVSFAVQHVSHIVNDGSTDLYVAFDADSTVAVNRITIKPGEVLEDFSRACTALHYSCASGACAFRAVGVA